MLIRYLSVLLCNHKIHLVPARRQRLENFIIIRHRPYSLFIWKEENQADLKSSDTLIPFYIFTHSHTVLKAFSSCSFLTNMPPGTHTDDDLLFSTES